MMTEEPSGDVRQHTGAIPRLQSQPMSKSVVLTGFGGYEKLRCELRPYPNQPKEGELIVRVRAAGVNFSDVNLRQGLHDRLPDLPVVVGAEASGDVIQVGPDVKGFQVGDRVMCVRHLGLWSEYITIETKHCTLMPDSMSYEEGATLPINYVTAYHVLFNFGNLQEGQSVLVHVAAGGVGMAATQLCRTVPNVTIFGTSSLSKHDAIQRNGVDHPINYRSDDYVEEIKKVDPEGVDIVLDPLSGQDSVKGYNLLKPLGKIIHYGATNRLTGTSKSYIGMMKTYLELKSYTSRDLIMDNRAVCGYHMGKVSSNVIKSTMDRLIKLYVEGKIKPYIDSVWAFEDVGLAMARIQERANIGKVILSPCKEPQQVRRD